MTLWGFYNANYTEDSCNCKSTSRYVFMLAGGPIVWKSKKQMSVALSTTEVEYYALGIAYQEAVWIWQLFQELFTTFNNPIHIYLVFPQLQAGSFFKSIIAESIKTLKICKNCNECSNKTCPFRTKL